MGTFADVGCFLYSQLLGRIDTERHEEPGRETDRHREMRKDTESHREAQTVRARKGDRERGAEAWGQHAVVALGTSANVDCFPSLQCLGRNTCDAQADTGRSGET